MGVEKRGRECDQYRVQWRSRGNKLMKHHNSQAVHSFPKWKHASVS